MAKGLRSKVKKRWRALKRRVIEQKVGTSNLEELQNRLKATIQGVEYRQKEPLNAFKYPKAPNAAFP